MSLAEVDRPTGQDDPARGPLRLRPSRRLLSWSAIPWLAVPALVAAAYGLLPPVTEPRALYQASGTALVVALLVAVLLAWRSSLGHHTAAAVVAAFVPGLTLIALHGSDWYFSGPFGDQSFRLQYATRFADDLTALGDYTYRDVPAFYSPAFFWVVGATAALGDVPAWQAYKWVAIATLFLAGSCAFFAWRLTQGTRAAALLVAVTTIGMPAATAGWIGGETLVSGGHEPYAWLVALPLVPLLAWFAAPRPGPSARRGALLGVALAAAAWLYLLYAMLAVLAVLLVTASTRQTRARFAEVVLAGLVSMVLVAPWLGRFVLAWVGAGTPPALATTWIEDDSYVRLALPAASPWFLVAVLGVVASLAVPATRDSRLLACRALLGGVLVLAVVQILAGQVGRGVLFHRLLPVLAVTALAAGTIALVRARTWLAEHPPARYVPAVADRWLAVVLGVCLLVGTTAHSQEFLLDAGGRGLAHGVQYPNGDFPVLVPQETRAGLADEPTAAELEAAARDVAARAGLDHDESVLLANNLAVLATSDFYVYEQWWSLYANPLGDYEGRRVFLTETARLPADAVADALRDNKEGPTVFLLEERSGQAVYSSSAWEPLAATSTEWTVAFPPGTFDRPDFVTTRVGRFLVAALRPA